jgi:hypothetical protein
MAGRYRAPPQRHERTFPRSQQRSPHNSCDAPFAGVGNRAYPLPVEDAVRRLAAHFRQWDEPHLAAAVEDTLTGDPAHLPRRVLALFTRGMGGLMDRPLYLDGAVDQRATEERDLLADRLYEQARSALS